MFAPGYNCHPFKDCMMHLQHFKEDIQPHLMTPLGIRVRMLTTFWGTSTLECLQHNWWHSFVPLGLETLHNKARVLLKELMYLRDDKTPPCWHCTFLMDVALFLRWFDDDDLRPLWSTLLCMMTSCPSSMTSPSCGLDWWHELFWWWHLVQGALLDD